MGDKVMTHASTISQDKALQKAHGEYEKFRLHQLSETTEAEKHFLEAEQEIKQIKSAKKNRKP